MKKVALIGKPLRRRHSEIMHNAAFREYGIDAAYELREIEPASVPTFVAEARDSQWLGFQVTAPYKRLVMGHLDQIEHGASQIGAVNSVCRGDNARLIGFNTDAPGFQKAAETELGMILRDLRVAVAGAGGAARAVVHALVAARAESVVVGNRTVSKAIALADDFGETVSGMDLGQRFENALGDVDLAINATTVGMLEAGPAFDVRSLPDTAAVYDLVYAPPTSALLSGARKRGLRASNGLGMLVAQAEVAFERWTGIPDSGPVMLSALVEHTAASDEAR